ncbi:MAG: ArsA-related P-loop ATPase [Pseudomonadales bacterium]
MSRLDLPALVRSSRVIVCCGSGGVGKTTSAAALGVLAARLGRKAQVMTIDPARRLAQAMGLEALDDQPRRVDLPAPGELWAMMLDTQRAFDRLVARHAPDAKVRDAIYANAYYQQLSRSLAGSRELVAMERVLEATLEGDQDLLIVDTAPSQHALDFLDAPGRLVSLLDGSMTGWLLRPYGLAARAQFDWFRQSSALTLKFFERLAGVQVLADLSDFLLAFSSMFDGFRERSHRVQALMREPSTAFLLVCAPEAASLSQVDRFAERLSGDGFGVAGVLVNRVHPGPEGIDATVAGAEQLSLSDDDVGLLAAAGEAAYSDMPLPDRLAELWREDVLLRRADLAALAPLRTRDLPLHTVPRWMRDLHSMADLQAFADALAAQP